MNSLKKWTRRSAWILLWLVGILLLLTLVVNVFFKDQLIRYVISQLNSQVDARIHIRKVDFTLWKRFPNASVRLDNVLAQSANPFRASYHKTGQDTLLKAEEIYVEFNLFHLLSGDYQIQNILVKNGFLNLVLSKEGISNFDILKKGTTSSNSSSAIGLKNLMLKNIQIKYKDLKSDVLLSFLTDETDLSGTFGKTIQISLKSDFFLHQIAVKSETYLHDVPVKVKTGLILHDSMVVIRNGSLSLRELSFLANGKIIATKEGKLQLTIEGDNLDLSQFLDALPEKIRSGMKDYLGKGNANFKMKLSGFLNNPEIKADFSLSDGQITQKATGMKLKEISLLGSFYSGTNNLKSFTLFQLNRFSANLGSGTISGSGSLTGLNGEQKFQLKSSYKINLNDLKDFINDEKVELFSGEVSGKVNSSGKLPNDFKISDIKDLKCNGNASLSDVKIKMKNSEYLFEKMNGEISLDNDFSFQNISLMVHDNDFLINGSLTGAMPYFLKQRSDMTLKAEVFSKHLDLSKYFVSTNSPDKANQEYSRELLFPENINLDVKVSINDFKLNRFTAKNISGNVNYRPKIFILKSLSFTSLSGKVSGNGVILQDVYKNFMVQGQANVSQLDIQQMFYSFNNFSQNILQDKHLRGRVSGQISFSSEWNNALNLNQDKLLVDADLTITNGQLIQFEPLEGLSRFCSVDDLRNVKFSTLKNKFLIKDKQIVIPQMDIESSAFGISASGIHKFDNHYEYKLKVSLSEILWHKSNRSRQNDFGEVEEDGLGKFNIPLSITGFGNDYKIKPAPKLLVSDVKESFKKQKGELKSILKEEFGWYKNDTTVTSGHKSVKSKSRVSWDDADENRSDETAKTRTKPKTNPGGEKPKIEWE